MLNITVNSSIKTLTRVLIHLLQGRVFNESIRVIQQYMITPKL